MLSFFVILLPNVERSKWRDLLRSLHLLRLVEMTKTIMAGFEDPPLCLVISFLIKSNGYDVVLFIETDFVFASEPSNSRKHL